MRYPFNAEFNLTLFCFNDGERFLNIPSQTATLYIFTQKPTLENALAGTGAIATASRCAISGDSMTFVIPAIDDPYPENDFAVWDYWVACNFILESGGETQTIIRAIQLSRIIAVDDDYKVNHEQMLKYAPQLSAYLSDEQLDIHAELAILFVKESLRNKGVDLSKIDRPSRFQQPATFKALSLAYLSQIQQSGDKFNVLANTFEQAYSDSIGLLTYEYGSNGAIKTTQNAQVSNSITVLR